MPSFRFFYTGNTSSHLKERNSFGAGTGYILTNKKVSCGTYLGRREYDGQHNSTFIISYLLPVYNFYFNFVLFFMIFFSVNCCSEATNLMFLRVNIIVFRGARVVCFSLIHLLCSIRCYQKTEKNEKKTGSKRGSFCIFVAVYLVQV